MSPIPVPQFQIPALSPAALLGNQSDNDDSFSGAIERAMTNYAQQQLQERAQQHALRLEGMRETANRENLFTELLAGNDLVPIAEAPVFPGDAIPEYTALQGPAGSKYEGQEFVSTQQVESARRQNWLSQPFDLPGVEEAPGLTRGDVFNYSPSGGVQLISGDILNQVIGQPGGREALLATAEAMSSSYGAIPGMSQLASRMRELVAQDSFISNADVASATQQGFAAERFPAYEASVRAIALADQENRSRISATTLDTQNRWQIANSDETGQLGSRRDLRPDEFTAVSLKLTGNDAMMTPELNDLYEDLVNTGKLTPRVGVADLQAMLTSTYVQGQVSSTPQFAAFIQFMRGNLTDGRGNIINPAIEDYLDKNGFGVEDSELARFAVSPASAPFHAAHALASNGRAQRSQINQLVEQSGQGWLPFGLEGPNGAFSAFEMLYGDAFNDVPASPPRGDLRPSGLDGEAEEAATAEALSAFEPYRLQFQSTLAGKPPEVTAEFGRILKSGDAEAIADGFAASADQHLRAAISAASPAERRAHKSLATFYREQASFYRNSPAQARILTDSVFVPILDNLAATGGGG